MLYEAAKRVWVARCQQVPGLKNARIATRGSYVSTMSWFSALSIPEVLCLQRIACRVFKLLDDGFM
jgi:hypothetical protein